VYVLTGDRSGNCNDDTFVITPRSGIVEGQTSLGSDYQTVLNICFTPHVAQDYEAIFIIEGVLGEEQQLIQIRGQGTLDGRFENLVNV
jgi:hypothetical protein